MGKGKTFSITQEEMERLLDRAADRAVSAYQREIAEEKKKSVSEEKAKFDRRYRNTKMLLEHYRDFSEYDEKAIYRISNELDEDIVDIIELMEGRRIDRDGKIESIERGVIRTRVIMNHVDKKMSRFTESCENYYQEEKHRWRVIERALFDDGGKTKQMPKRASAKEVLMNVLLKNGPVGD